MRSKGQFRDKQPVNLLVMQVDENRDSLRGSKLLGEKNEYEHDAAEKHNPRNLNILKIWTITKSA